jgi:flagellar biosynthesis/type III secretory pathway protein FliH
MTEEEDRQKKYNTEMKIMKEKVKKQAINSGLKQGLKEGLKQGIEQGIEKGIEKGSTETKINAVKNLLLNKVNEDIIMDSLNISKIELENIKKSIR